MIGEVGEISLQINIALVNSNVEPEEALDLVEKVDCWLRQDNPILQNLYRARMGWY